MKKIFNTLSILLFLQVTSYAQQAATGAIETKIADVLAQQPAENQTQMLHSMTQLESLSSGQIAELLKNLKPQGEDNAAIEFATNSYALHVMQPSKDEFRERFVQGLLQALDEIKDQNNQGYVLELLKFCAKNEAVDKVKTYLHHDFLGEKAARVLSAIHTKESSEALLQGLGSSVNMERAQSIISALGELKYTAAEQRILELAAKFHTQDFDFAVFTALSKLGTEKSYDFLFAKAKAKDFCFDRANISSLLINYARNLAASGNTELATKIANRVFDEADLEYAIGAKIAALDLLVDLDPKGQRKHLLALSMHENSVLSSISLSLLEQDVEPAEIKKLTESLLNLPAGNQQSMLDFLKRNSTSNTIEFIQKSFSKFKNEDSRIAALNTLSVLTKGSNADFLIKQLSVASAREKQEIKSLLITAKDSNSVQIINKAVADSDDSVKIVLLDVLSKRSNENTSSEVLKLVNHSNSEVQNAAYKTLPFVVNDEDFDAVVELLSKADDSQLQLVQHAAINCLINNPQKSSLVKRMAGNISRSVAPSAAKFFPILAGEGSQEALTAVHNYTADNNPLRLQAIQALANWSNSSSLDHLLGLLRKEKQENVFETIFNGFINQLKNSSLNNDQKTILLKDAFEYAQNTKQKNTVLSSLKSVGTYSALVFASKYLDHADFGKVATDVVMNIATDHKEYYGSDVRNWLTKAEKNLSGNESSYLSASIVRHLAEMPKGEGYVSLFNGKDLTGWKGLVEDPIKRAAMTEDELQKKQQIADQKMRESWSAENGSLVFSGKGDNIATVKKYGDFELILDWKLDENGEEPDAGVYLRGTPQVQIWDISRTNVGAQVGSGGLYNNQKHESKPLKVADNPLGEWNNFKIRMKGEKVSVWLNGELVVDEVILENYWDRNQAIFPVEQIELQAHGSRVWYRDIYIKEL